jgi:hypothetical protein
METKNEIETTGKFVEVKDFGNGYVWGHYVGKRKKDGNIEELNYSGTWQTLFFDLNEKIKIELSENKDTVEIAEKLKKEFSSYGITKHIEYIEKIKKNITEVIFLQDGYSHPKVYSFEENTQQKNNDGTITDKYLYEKIPNKDVNIKIITNFKDNANGIFKNIKETVPKSNYENNLSTPIVELTQSQQPTVTEIKTIPTLSLGENKSLNTSNSSNNESNNLIPLTIHQDEITISNSENELLNTLYPSVQPTPLIGEKNTTEKKQPMPLVNPGQADSKGDTERIINTETTASEKQNENTTPVVNKINSEKNTNLEPQTPPTEESTILDTSTTVSVEEKQEDTALLQMPILSDIPNIDQVKTNITYYQEEVKKASDFIKSPINTQTIDIGGYEQNCINKIKALKEKYKINVSISSESKTTLITLIITAYYTLYQYFINFLIEIETHFSNNLVEDTLLKLNLLTENMEIYTVLKYVQSINIPEITITLKSIDDYLTPTIAAYFSNIIKKLNEDTNNTINLDNIDNILSNLDAIYKIAPGRGMMYTYEIDTIYKNLLLAIHTHRIYTLIKNTKKEYDDDISKNFSYITTYTDENGKALVSNMETYEKSIIDIKKELDEKYEKIGKKESVVMDALDKLYIEYVEKKINNYYTYIENEYNAELLSLNEKIEKLKETYNDELYSSCLISIDEFIENKTIYNFKKIKEVLDKMISDKSETYLSNHEWDFKVSIFDNGYFSKIVFDDIINDHLKKLNNIKNQLYKIHLTYIYVKYLKEIEEISLLEQNYNIEFLTSVVSEKENEKKNEIYLNPQKREQLLIKINSLIKDGIKNLIFNTSDEVKYYNTLNKNWFLRSSKPKDMPIFNDKINILKEYTGLFYNLILSIEEDIIISNDTELALRNEFIFKMFGTIKNIKDDKKKKLFSNEFNKIINNFKKNIIDKKKILTQIDEDDYQNKIIDLIINIENLNIFIEDFKTKIKYEIKLLIETLITELKILKKDIDTYNQKKEEKNELDNYEKQISSSANKLDINEYKSYIDEILLSSDKYLLWEIYKSIVKGNIRDKKEKIKYILKKIKPAYENIMEIYNKIFKYEKTYDTYIERIQIDTIVKKTDRNSDIVAYVNDTEDNFAKDIGPDLVKNMKIIKDSINNFITSTLAERNRLIQANDFNEILKYYDKSIFIRDEILKKNNIFNKIDTETKIKILKDDIIGFFVIPLNTQTYFTDYPSGGGNKSKKYKIVKKL